MELAASKIIRLKITSESTAKAKESKDNVGKCMNNLDESKRVQETGIGIDAHFLPTDLGVLRRRTYDQRAALPSHVFTPSAMSVGAAC